MKRMFCSLAVLLMVTTVFGEINPGMDSSNLGIQFETGLNWKQIVKKARLEHRYIFVDCYTTWCGPCKAMEKEVYSTQGVGSLYNAKFISVKMQMDTSAKDDAAVKATYADARYI